MQLNERAEKLENWRMKEKSREEEKKEERELLRKQSSLWIDEGELAKKTLEAMVDAKSLEDLWKPWCVPNTLSAFWVDVDIRIYGVEIIVNDQVHSGFWYPSTLEKLSLNTGTGWDFWEGRYSNFFGNMFPVCGAYFEENVRLL